MEDLVKNIIIQDYSVSYDRFSNTYSSSFEKKILLLWEEFDETRKFGSKDLRNTPFVKNYGTSELTKIELSFSFQFVKDHFVWYFTLNHTGYKNSYLSENSEFRFLVDDKVYNLAIINTSSLESESFVTFAPVSNNLNFLKSIAFGKRIDFSFKYSPFKNDLLLEDSLTNENLSFLELKKMLLLQICLQENDKVDSFNLQLIQELSSEIEEKRKLNNKLETKYYENLLNNMEKKKNPIGFFLNRIFR